MWYNKDVETQAGKGPKKGHKGGLRIHVEEIRSKRFKLLLKRFQTDTRRQFFTVRTTSHCNDLPNEVVDSSTLYTFEIQMDR